MKDFSSPVSTPFTIANGPSTASGSGSNHYFAASHRAAAPTSSLFLSTTSEKSSGFEQVVYELPQQVAAVVKSESPIDAVPNEIISLILEHGYFDCVGGLPNAAFRNLTSNISRRFRDLTMHTPSLWGIVHLSPGNVFEDVELLPVYLARSKSHPLDIHMSCFWALDLTEQLMQLLVPHSQKWRQLSITTLNEHILSFLQHLSVPFLAALTISHYSSQRRVTLPSPLFNNDLPRLKYLCLRNVDIDNIEFSLRNLTKLEIRGYGSWPIFARLDDMLGGSNALRHLVLHVKPSEVLQQVRLTSESSGTRHSGQIFLPGLEFLDVYTSEWLTEDIAEFLQLFACPHLELLTMRESVTSATEKANMVMRYEAFGHRGANPFISQLHAHPWDTENYSSTHAAEECRRRLWVRSASVYHACRAMSFSGASILTTLELHKVFFPRLTSMKEVFSGLKSLEVLLLLDFQPNNVLCSIMNVDTSDLDDIDWTETQGGVVVPSLRRLVMEFNHSPSSSTRDQVDCPMDRTSEFIRLFRLPALSSLVLKGSSLFQWRGVADAFAQPFGQEEAYPKLTSLEIIDMKEPVPLCSNDYGYVDPVKAFPKLERLSLNGVNSNAFVRCLVREWWDPTPPSFSSTTWPTLHTLSIANDVNASKPLLHRVITTREEAGCALVGLYLDAVFQRNAESWKWMKEKVCLLTLLDADHGTRELDWSANEEVGGWR